VVVVVLADVVVDEEARLTRVVGWTRGPSTTTTTSEISSQRNEPPLATAADFVVLI
jgi:hypothetical protein